MCFAGRCTKCGVWADSRAWSITAGGPVCGECGRDEIPEPTDEDLRELERLRSEGKLCVKN